MKAFGLETWCSKTKSIVRKLLADSKGMTLTATVDNNRSNFVKKYKAYHTLKVHYLSW